MHRPGQTQGSYLAKAIIESVAARLRLDPEIVHERNFHDVGSLRKYNVESPESYTLPLIWEHLMASANWVDYKREVKRFNENSTWMKRGLALISIIYGNPSSSKSTMVSIFVDGSIVLGTAGVEIGQGLHTKV